MAARGPSLDEGDEKEAAWAKTKAPLGAGAVLPNRAGAGVMLAVQNPGTGAVLPNRAGAGVMLLVQNPGTVGATAAEEAAAAPYGEEHKCL